MSRDAVADVVALMTCHNRRERTMACLRRLCEQGGLQTAVGVVLVDDGSTDGTGSAVRGSFPDVRIVDGTGQLFWAGGMALAQVHAMGSRPDFLLWLNDDVLLDPGAVALLVRTASEQPGAIVVGAVRDPDSGVTTYTGVRRRGGRPRQLEPVEPSGEPVPIDAFNGNVVLVPRIVYEAVGPVDAKLRHGYADHDYGMRATALGHRSVLAPVTVGTCSRNPTTGSWRDPKLTRGARLRALLGRKGMPLGPHVRFTRRHGDWRWPAYVAGGYAKALGTVLFTRRQGS